MKITEKLFLERDGLETYGPITIVAFGDSVTHGALRGTINYDTVYWNRLRQKMNAVRNYMPINVINAAIGGTTAKASVARMEKQVFQHEPDMVIVCFGLNDVNGTLEDYIEPLRTIFARCKESGAETIFMTPNMLNTYVAEDTEPQYFGYAAVTADMQNNGRMDTYMNAAKALAEEMGIPVCDCYAKWKKLSETEDVTQMLCNRINHPTPEMHELFAQSLFEMIFADMPEVISPETSTMYNK